MEKKDISAKDNFPTVPVTCNVALASEHLRVHVQSG